MTPGFGLYGATFAILAFVLVVSTTGCDRFNGGAANHQKLPPIADPRASTVATVTPSIAEDNRILYTSNDFAIHVVDPDGSNRHQLSLKNGRYTWPGWSPDGQRVVFSSFHVDPTRSGEALHSMEIAEGAQTLLFQNAQGSRPAIGTRIPHYSVWSPDGRFVAFIATGELRQSVYVTSASGLDEPQFMATGTQLYLAWSHDSRYLLIHQGAELLRVDMRLPEEVMLMNAKSLAYRVPAWSPSDDAIAFVATDGDLEKLYLASTDGSPWRVLSEINGFASFLWSPNGDWLAIGQTVSNETKLMQNIQLINIANGEIQLLAERPILGFSWSPDSSKIAYVTTNTTENSLQWRMADIATLNDQRLMDFHPSPDQLIWLAYFDQYASSHSAWSPDSRRLIFAGTLEESSEANDTSTIFVLDTENPTNARPIAAGLFASWLTRQTSY